MKRLFFALMMTSTLLLTSGCGDDKSTNPNAPVAQQPNGSAGKGWTQDQIQQSAERCAAYGLLSSSGTRLNPWLNFCSCSYSAASQVATFNQFASQPDYYINQIQSQVQGCLSSSGLSGGSNTTRALEAY